METVTIPRAKAIQRGDRWALPVLLHDDFSAKTFSCTFAHSRFSADTIEAEVNTDDINTPGTTGTISYDGFLTIILTADQTADITDNLITGELQAAADETWFAFTVPVVGQINVTSS